MMGGTESKRNTAKKRHTHTKWISKTMENKAKNVYSRIYRKERGCGNLLIDLNKVMPFIQAFHNFTLLHCVWVWIFIIYIYIIYTFVPIWLYHQLREQAKRMSLYELDSAEKAYLESEKTNIAFGKYDYFDPGLNSLSYVYSIYVRTWLWRSPFFFFSSSFKFGITKRIHK